MTKRLGYATDHVMLNLERKLNESMNNDPKINKSALVNELLRKYFEGKLCPRCFTPNIDHHTCQKCSGAYIVCRDEEKPGGFEAITFRSCKCTVREMYGATGEWGSDVIL